jgi:prohibitin 1
MERRRRRETPEAPKHGAEAPKLDFASVFGGTAGGIWLVQNSIYDVKGGTRAVIFDRLSGVQEQVVNEGTHFLIPWLQKAIIYDVRTKPRNISTTTGSKDLQMVSLTLRVLNRPEVPKLPQIYQVCFFQPSSFYLHKRNLSC